ncbi:sensor histidine kinase [Spirosoma radiotolerans]|uniref:sensor histidine kinase n=1 Tax=Spirosoma radiotolerans TaxID=1379870 RepID=UPI000697327C|nr:ATP-binding protein [Spirosoma radiotolerans]
MLQAISGTMDNDPLPDRIYQNAFRAMNRGFCLLDVRFDEQGLAKDMIIRDASPAQNRIDEGLPLRGESGDEFLPGLDPNWIERYVQVALTREAAHFEDWSETSQRWYEVDACSVGGPNSSLVALSYSDITQRKRQEESLLALERRQSFLLRLSDELRPLSNAVSIQYQAARVLGEFLQANRVGYAETQEDEQLVAVTRHFTRGVAGIEGVYRYVDYGPELLEQMLRGQTVVRDDVANDSRLTQAEKQAHAQLQLGATVNVPLVKQGRLVAILFVHFQRDHSFSALEIGLIEETAERIWAAVERARAEQALLKSEAEFRTMAEAAPALVWICSALGENIYFNPRWYDYTGQTVEQARGLGWAVRMHPDDVNRILPYWQACQQTGEAYEGEVRYRRHDGMYRWHIFRSLPRRSATGQIEAWYGLSIDIDDAKRAEQDLQQASHRKDEFLAMLAHELRNPLAPVHNGLQLLAQTHQDDPMLGAILPSMNRQMDHLLRLVDDLLDVSRISRGKIELRTQRIDLVQVVAQTVDTMQPLFRVSARQLHVQLPSHCFYMNGDATRLTQVVTNLLTNGLRYTYPEGQVWLSLERVGEQAVLRVRDNGIGLAADQLGVIFELFRQVDTSLARSQGGLGVGLSLVQQLVEQHGGRVGVQSEGQEKGSEFTIHLPLLPA